MPYQPDIQYFTRRAAQSRQAEERAAHDSVRIVHGKLATAFEALARKAVLAITAPEAPAVREPAAPRTILRPLYRKPAAMPPIPVSAAVRSSVAATA